LSLRVACTAPDRPLPTVRPQPVELGVNLVDALGEAAHQHLGHPLEFQ
jgi:hypothetical protein